MMLGVYDYTVVLTYVSVLISMGGMLFSMNGYPRMAIVCLALSGFCDMFDGKIARTKKNRTEVEKKFGIQIDSLADIICFGVGPTLIAYRMGMNHGIGVALPILYVFRPILGRDFIIALHALVLIIGLLFITNFRLRKPKKLGQTVMVVIVALAVLHGLHIW